MAMGAGCSAARTKSATTTPKPGSRHRGALILAPPPGEAACNRGSALCSQTFTEPSRTPRVYHGAMRPPCVTIPCWARSVARTISSAATSNNIVNFNHWCPVKYFAKFDKALTVSGLRRFVPCRDLNGNWLQESVLRRRTMVHEPGPHRLLAIDRLPAGSRVSSLRRALRWRRPLARLLLLGPVSDHGLRSTHLSGEPAGHRSMPPCSGCEVVPHGLPEQGGALYSGRRQRVS